jgi:hypothetical protein
MFYGSGVPLAVTIALSIASMARQRKFKEAGPRRSFMLDNKFGSYLPNHEVEQSGTGFAIALVLRG